MNRRLVGRTIAGIVVALAVLVTTMPTASEAMASTRGVNAAPFSRYILVSRAQQWLWVIVNGKKIFNTRVTTGGPGRGPAGPSFATPAGTYWVLAKYSPYTMISPWPVGSPYYYQPSYMNWALQIDNDGRFIHDAPWRSNFGPGSNSRYGTPGGNLTGSHGCINVPEPKMRWLYAWAQPGTPVVVR